MELHFLGFLILFFLFLGVYELTKNIRGQTTVVLNDRGEYEVGYGGIIVGSNEYLITIANMEFSEEELNIRTGDRLIFKNLDNVRHQVVNNIKEIPNSKILTNYEEYSLIITYPGKYIFSSPLYKKMNKLVVNVVS